VAGWWVETNSVPQGTVESLEFSLVPSGRDDLWMRFQPRKRSGLANFQYPIQDKKCAGRKWKGFSGVDGGAINSMRKYWTAISAQITVVL
jgi:hypothetical protein